MAAVANTNTPPPAAAAAATTASPPWSQIVRGPEPEEKPKRDVTPAASDVTATESDVTAAENGEGRKSSAWNKKPMTTKEKTSNGGEAAESGGGGGGAVVVMGAEMWPSLAECTKVSPKLSSSSPSSSSFENSMNHLPSLPPQVTRIDTPSTTTAQLSVRSPSSISHRQTVSSPNHHMASNHVRPTRQKFTKRDGGNSSLANGGPSHQSSQLAGDGARHHHNHSSAKPNSGGSFESSGRDHVQNHSHRESGQRNSSGEHYHHRNPFRKGNGGPHSRGDGSHQNYGGRRSDQERGSHDLNHQRSFNGRDGSMHPRGFPRGFVRPPPITPNMIYQTVPPFPNPMIPVVYPLAMPVLGPLGPVFVHGPGLELYPELLKQINFYFSNENLVRDTYLRNAMDENGWVHVDFIAEFNRVKQLTNDTYLILEAVRPSTVVEVQGDKIRKRDDWKRWVLPPSLRFPPASGSQSPNHQAVAAVTDQIQSVSVEEKVNYTSTVRGQGDGSVTMSQASSGDSDSASKVSVKEANTGGS